MMHNEEPVECPLCMEPLEMDDINFYPCTCGYQICRFCWHRIRTDENGLCPACRKAYQECPADFKPLSEEELQRIKNEKKQKDQQRKQKISENRKHLASVRVVQKNLVFVVGLSQRLADQEVLKKQEYFGKFGNIIKVVINQNTSYAGSQGPSASAYVTYQKAEDALRAIQAVNNVHVDGRTVKASLGTTKYCSHFLKNTACPKPDCMYLHELGDEAASFTKEDMQMGNHQEYEQRLLSDLFGGSSSSSSATSSQQQPVTAITTSATATTSNSNSLQNSQQSSVITQQQTEGNRTSPINITTATARKKTPSPPITTNHNNTEAWPSLQREGGTGSNTPDEKSQSPTVETTSNTGSVPPVANHASDRTLDGIPVPLQPLVAELQPVIAGTSPGTSNSQSASISSEFSGTGTPSPDSTSGLPSSNNPTSRSPFESHENSSFFSANGFLPHILGLGGPPPLIPPGPPPNLPPPPPQQHTANDWSEGLVLSNELPPVNSQTDWQAAFEFGSELKDKQNPEDDLGFDPWNESSKGLADLLEKELQLGSAAPVAGSQVTQPPSGFNPASFNHTLAFGIRPPSQPAPADASGSKMFQWMQNKPPRLPPGHPLPPMSSMPPPFQPGMGMPPPPPGKHPPLPPGVPPPHGFSNHTPRVPPPLSGSPLSTNPQCPLCMEPLEMDDINFYPCTCGYQICRFCWHRIRTDENGLCPACRKAYQECPADFKPLSEEELQRIKNEKKQKDQQRKQKISENRKHLASVRVVQKNLVFVVGLSQRLADQEVLKKQEYFGKYGKIIKVVINQNTSYAGSQGPSASAYVTYQKAEDALRAIQAVNNVHVDGRTLKASLGTTKYCSHFLKNTACPKPDCMYLHELGDEAASFTKEDMQMGNHQEYEQRLLSDLFGGSSSSSSATNSQQQPVTAITTSATATTSNSNSLQNSQQSSVITQQQTEGNRTSPINITTATARKKTPSPPITTNHNNTEAWPSLQREGGTGSNTPDEKSQSPTVETTSNTGSVPPVANHASDRTLDGIPVPLQPLVAELQPVIAGTSPGTSNSQSASISSEFSGTGTPSPDSTSGLPSSNNPTSRSPFESHENSSFFSANGFLPHILGLGGPPPLIPPGPPPNLPPPPPQQHTANDWSEGLVLSKELPPVNSQTDWQAAFEFGSELKDKQNPEDDLGFDPWNESSKGLADLLEKELQLGSAAPVAGSQVTQPPPGFNPASFNHTLAFGIRPPSQPAPADASGSKMFQWMQNKPPRLPPGHPLPPMSSMPPPFQPGMGMPPPPPGKRPPLPPGVPPPHGFSNHTPRVPPPLSGSPLSTNPQSEPNIDSWQEGLRALLPNINISFGVPNFTQQQIPTTHSADTWSGGMSQSSWSKHQDPAIISINSSNSLNTGSTTTAGPSTAGPGLAGGLLDKDGEEQSPRWLESLQTLTEPEESPTHSNHLFPSHQHNNRGPSWTTHAPPSGLHPQIRPNSQTTEPHTLTENLEQ